jgi:activator of HSP90 ATPase
MKAEVGAEMSLFGGNISGKVTAVDRPHSISTTWRAPTWPEGELISHVSCQRRH